MLMGSPSWSILLRASLSISLSLICTLCALSQGAVFWAVNGVGLSLVIPNGQSLIADYYEDLDRGKAFGALYLTGALGAMVGTVFATNISAGQTTGIFIAPWSMRVEHV